MLVTEQIWVTHKWLYLLSYLVRTLLHASQHNDNSILKMNRITWKYSWLLTRTWAEKNRKEKETTTGKNIKMINKGK